MRTLGRDDARALDERAQRDFGLPGIVLMENAGRNAAELIAALWPAGEIAILCGRGNNGGDGLVIARHLDRLGRDVRVVLSASPDSFSGDAAVNLGVVLRSGIRVAAPPEGDPASWERAIGGAAIVVDALLGTGATGEPRGAVAAAIDAANAAKTRAAGLFAVDVPSGLDCDTGRPAGRCVRADHTGTFVSEKRGFSAPSAAAFTGRVHVLDIGLPRAALRW
jgi:NAD(P)H-hydrate epimerase